MLNSIPTTPDVSPPPSHNGVSASSPEEQQLDLAAGLVTSAKVVKLDGYTLSLAEVVAVARNQRPCVIDSHPAIKARIDDSVEFLKSKVRYRSHSPLSPLSRASFESSRIANFEIID